MDNKITYLTGKQLNKYYQEYLRAKHTTHASIAHREGESAILDARLWRAEIEQYLNYHEKPMGRTFSQEQIRAANKKLMEQGNFTGKQKSAIRASMERGFAGTGTEEEVGFWRSFSEKHPNITEKNIGGYWALVSDFLSGYSGNWKEYFNS